MSGKTLQQTIDETVELARGLNRQRAGDFVCGNCGYLNVPARHAWCDCPKNRQRENSGRTDPPPDPVREATERRTAMWMNGERGVL